MLNSALGPGVLGACVGTSVGLAVGTSVGLALGFSVGFIVGDSVGFAVGTLVGGALGFSDGFSVGLMLGCSVGLALGFSVGLTVGSSVGFRLGSSVDGFMLGCSVVALLKGAGVGNLSALPACENSADGCCVSPISGVGDDLPVGGSWTSVGGTGPSGAQVGAPPGPVISSQSGCGMITEFLK